MIRNFKDVVVLLITTGVLILLGTIIIGDYIVALEENRPVDDSVITIGVNDKIYIINVNL